MKPYIGLRPYEEENQDIFFGRNREREILIDKLLVNKLTLLFAATGVGKSSLLRAAVLPQLKKPGKANLDVVYYSDWVSDPLEKLKEETINVLKAREKVASDYPTGQGISLKKFFRLCATFASDPLVVILDQFEEFFQYRKYRENFIPFIEEFSQCISDRQAPVVFLISMREDFALELNIFKNYLLATPFENYFRLEKLKEEAAKDALRLPVERCGFHYEDELLSALLKDLAERDKVAQLGTSPEEWGKDMPAYVEPPYLQIVCTQLWDLEKQNPEKKIRMEVYKEKGRAKGFVNYYFHDVMNKFSLPEKKIASLSFNHLVTPRGTKMAYPVKDLANLLRVEEKDLENILEKLRKSRILRSQKREGVMWYELYHDIFSDIIYDWNEKFKAKQRFKLASFVSAAAIIFFVVLFLIYDIISNSTSHYIRLSAKAGISDTIEVYRGKLGTLDIANRHRYRAETVYRRHQVEPDKLFGEKQVGDFADLNNELMGHLPLLERISAYWHSGETGKALKLAGDSISERNIPRTEQAIALIPGFGSIKSYELLKQRLDNCANSYIKERLVNALALMPPSLIEGDFIALLEDKNAGIRQAAAFTLSQIGSKKAVEPLIQLLKDQEWVVRSNAADALGSLGALKAVDPLIQLLKDQESYVRSSAVDALGRLGSLKAVDPLIRLLKDQDSDVRRIAAFALGSLGSLKAMEPLIRLLKDRDPDVRRSAVISLGKLSASEKKKDIENIYKNKEEKPAVRMAAAAFLLKFDHHDGWEYLKENTGHDNVNIRIRLAEILGQVISIQGTSLLIDMLNDENFRLKRQVILSLGNINEKRALNQLSQILEDPNPNIRETVVEALGKIPSPGRIVPLKNIVLDTDEIINLRKNAFTALAKIQHEDTVKILLELLDNKEEIITYNALLAIGRMKSYDFINHRLKQQLKITLKKHLNRLEERKARWRKTRDEETDRYTKEQTDAWQVKLKNLEPNEPMEFEFAFALSRIDPGEEGIKLLSHHLANVRQGAWMGVGKSRNVSLIERLYWLQKESNKPWVRHAAYRAIDHILINIETLGGETEQNDLEVLSKKIEEKEGKDFHPGVYTRMEWTIKCLRERVGQ